MTGSSIHGDQEVSRGQIEAAGPGVEADKHEDSEARIDAPGGNSGHLLRQTVTWSNGAIPENVKREENKSKSLIKETLPDSTLVANSSYGWLKRGESSHYNNLLPLLVSGIHNFLEGLSKVLSVTELPKSSLEFSPSFCCQRGHHHWAERS